MSSRKFLHILLSSMMIATLIFGGIVPAGAQGEDPPPPPAADPDPDVITQAEREAAAAVTLQEGGLNPLMLTEPAMEMDPLPGAAPRYFSHPNYANSPLPTVEGAVIAVGSPLEDRDWASDTPSPVGELAPVLVLMGEALPDGMIQSFQTWNQATSGNSPAPSAGNVFHAYVLRPTGNADEYTVIFDSGLLTVPALTDPAVSEVATFPVANLAVQAGDRLAFYGQGVPVDIVAGGTDQLIFPAPTAPLQDSVITMNSAEYPVYPQERTYSFGAQVLDLSGQNTVVVGGIKKFVDTLPGLGAGAANNLGQYIPVAVPDTTTYPGSDYYVIELVEYTEQLHSNLPPTTLRGYRQEGGEAHYLGPAIVAQKDRPVRILFRNLLPTGMDGDLFIPVDSTVMGSGMTASGHEWMMSHPEMVDPLNPMCSGPDKAMMVAMGHCYADNRATLHLHGGISPWISDGTPHQWITPAGEDTPYPQGVSVIPVPDMGDSGNPTDGEMTFYYTNQQSARLMFYHDHAWGITRLNVYAGEAAPYIIQDETEQALVDNGLIPGPESTVPLVIQDKTFVPGPEQLAMQDETWDTERWGGEGSLWIPHVYSPAQNPGDASGVNEYGRWAYGPWFWPPTSGIEHGPVPNPYFDPDCDPDETWCEPPLMPGVPYVSMGMESFNDTPVVNGTAYPTLTVEPKPYRFRILNAANDRFLNLSLYQAIDANGVLCDANNPNPAPESTGVACTEVFLNPDEVEAALEDSTIFPTPVAGTEGPDWIAIGTEGGFLPAPTVIPAHPTTWVNDPTVFNAGNVDQHSLLTAPAERHDVIVDFSAFAGQTLILYNDAPAAFPARDPRYDYYTGNGDYRDTGGAPSTLPGYGPNTRTIMQIKVSGGAGQSFNLGALQNAFAHQPDGSGVFESGQHPIIVGQGEYNSAYGTSFRTNGPRNGTAQIYSTSLSFDTLSGVPLTIDLRPKMIQDEMGEAFELEYGRMSGFLGVETPNAQAGLQNMILHGYVYPPDEILQGVELPPGVEVTPLASTDDGTQIWKITHNGVDTHPIHWHLYDVQLINRVGWDGIVRKPDPNELGWKDTVRISPLEDTIVALRPIVPQIPPEWGGLPNSIRLLDPSMPEGEYLMGTNTTQRESMGLPILAFNPDGEPVDIINHFVNFSWEYVYHCHILSHEEMDMMHSQVVGVKPAMPTFVSAVRTASGTNGRYIIKWIDNSKNETAFVIERRAAGSNDPWSVVATVQSTQLGVVPFVNTGIGPGTGERTFTTDPMGSTTLYEFQVHAINVVGDVWDYSDPALNEIPAGGGWPTLTLASASDGGGSVVPPDVPAAPTELTGVVAYGPVVNFQWMDNAVDETGFVIERSDNGGAFIQLDTLTPFPDTGTVTHFDPSVQPGHSYSYRVYAENGAGASEYSNTLTIDVAPAPADPTNLLLTLQGSLTTTPRNRLVFRDNAINETEFVVERSDNGGGFQHLATLPPRAGRGNVTYFDTTILGGHTYEYRVLAVNGPSPSGYSNVAVMNVPPAPAAPSNFNGVASITGTTTRIDMSWTDNSNNESRFVVQRASDPGFTTNLATYLRTTNSISFAQTGLPFGVTFYYRIMAQNTYGQSDWVNLNPFPITTQATPPPPAAPSHFAATTMLTNGGTRVRINLSWMDNSDNETRFIVQRSTDPNFLVGVVSVNRAANSTSYAQAGLLRGTTYYYRIMAQNTYGDSVWVYLTITTP